MVELMEACPPEQYMRVRARKPSGAMAHNDDLHRGREMYLVHMRRLIEGET